MAKAKKSPPITTEQELLTELHRCLNEPGYEKSRQEFEVWIAQVVSDLTNAARATELESVIAGHMVSSDCMEHLENRLALIKSRIAA